MEIIPLTHAHLLPAVAPWRFEYEMLLGRLLWHLHTPFAYSVVALKGEDVVGMGCCILHGGTARITLVRAVPKPGAYDVHAAVVQRLLAYLDAQECTACSVTAPADDVVEWEALGFTAYQPILMYTDGKFYQATRDEVENMEPQHRLGVLHLDRQVTGEDRSTLLMEHGYLGSVYLEGSRVRGFSLPLLGEGLIIADAPDVGLELQRWLFPIQDHMLLPEGNTAHEHLTAKCSYTAERIGVHMVRGPHAPLRAEMVFGWPYWAV